MAATQRDSWDRWKLGWQHTFFGLLIAVSVAHVSVPSNGGPTGIAVRLALLAAPVGWYAYWFGPWPVPRSATVPYLIGAAGLWLALVVVDDVFWLVGFAVLVPVGMRHLARIAFAVAACGSLWLIARAADPAVGWPEVVTSMVAVSAGIACLGYLAVLDREGRRRAHLLDELAAAQARLAASEHHAGTLAERQRLAREVHDTLTQGFAGIVMVLEAAQASRNDHRATMDRHIATALRTARDNLTESRRLVWALQPAPLEKNSLPDAVRQQTDRLSDETGIAASTVVTGDPIALEKHAEGGVLRVVQEALSNARRHAHASSITVTLSYLPDVVLVDVRDNGVGMPTGRPSTGMGLRAMRERASELGATLTIESEPGEGTTVALAAPTRTAVPAGAKA